MAEQARAQEDAVPMSLLETILNKQHENMLEFAKEMRKPSELEQRKIDAENAKLMAKAESRRQAATAEMNLREMKRKNCSHSRTDGQHSWVGQVNADGFYRPMCQQCNIVLPAIKATSQQTTDGVNLHTYKRDGQTMLKHFEELHKSMECKDQACHVHRATA